MDFFVGCSVKFTRYKNGPGKAKCPYFLKNSLVVFNMNLQTILKANLQAILNFVKMTNMNTQV